MHRALALAFVCLSTLTGCSNLPEPKPMGPVAQAPEDLRAVRIHVHNATRHRVSDDEENVTGYTRSVRGQAERALVRAGYVVVVHPREPHDLVAVIHTDYQKGGGEGFHGSLITSLTLRTARGRKAVSQLAGTVRIDEGINVVRRDVASLVMRLAADERLRTYAARLEADPIPCAEPHARIASDRTPGAIVAP